MSKLINQIKHTVDATIPDKKELTHEGHRKRDYIMLVARNVFVCLAVIMFILSFFLDEHHYDSKAIAYFYGAGAYLFECLLITNCFKTKVPHQEMFMIYCLGPLYIIMGLSYIFK